MFSYAARALSPLAAFGEQIELLGAQSDEQVIARGATLHVITVARPGAPTTAQRADVEALPLDRRRYAGYAVHQARLARRLFEI